MTTTRGMVIVSILYWLLGMHFFMHNPGGAGLYLPFNAWGWIFASLVIALGLWQVTLRQRLVISSLQLGLWLGALLLLLPMTYPGFELQDYAIPRLLGLFAGLLFLFGLYQWRLERPTRDRLLYLLLGAVAIEALLGLVQYYLLTPGNWIGYDIRANRPYGIFQQPNVMASFMATGLALAIWLELRKEGNPWLQGLCYGVIVSTSLLLVVLQSRVGQLGGLLALILLVPQLYRQRQLGRMLGLAGLGIALGLLSLYGLAGAKRGLEIYQSGGMRSIYWPYAAKLIAEAPWTGWGYGSFESVFLQHYMADKAQHPAMVQIEYNLDHPHNEFLYWAVEGGIAPMLGMVLMGGALLWRVSRTGWVRGPALLALVTPILLHTQTEYPFYHSIAHWWALLLLVHVLDAEVEEGAEASWREYTYRPWLLLRFAAIAIPLIVVPFMLTAIHTAWVVTQYERGGYKQPALLLDIVNPMAWLTRVEFDVNAVRLAVGLQANNPTELEAYLDWGEAFVRHTPRANIYANMVLALKALGRTAEAESLRSRALQLYPGEPLLTGSAARSVATTLERKPSS
ncbi:Wzy polymerase domain-containing protein [Aeromonas caviae]|uniref:O-antigen ligase C-terminal domain-containing protein n=1 Tax=Aeromonas caviae TaxID=648 RepID=A0A7T3X7A4_AERCA|nr:Wzy polymerase domain-containing protein [Aeromonas caviae]MDH0434576.1 Wzy polymerase domain-containing protein [Aeromonas caviae]MDH0937424.1 Wzy polymerase domain-containing protein [Aeromonas caviae]MDH1398234.1 Wzy polymerase domain-containing protein [Aeromonas caviae]MDH1852163.1 Wzy polymerase domain-containing protein [Aeromonas caviae]QQA63311.1 O-antigen ligase C-terminal domain-containing protein [Aeromonas caviae]